LTEIILQLNINYGATDLSGKCTKSHHCSEKPRTITVRIAQALYVWQQVYNLQQ